jgi:protein TonB
MFETVVPEATIRKSRRIFYETLPVSIALHLIVVFGVILSAVWNVAFPDYSPRVTRAYQLTAIPDPPPPPPPPPPKTQAAAPVPKPVVTPLPVKILEMAPTVIPDLIPRVEQVPLPPDLPPAPVASADPTPAPVSGAGEKGGVPTGEAGGKKHGVAGGLVFAEDGRIHIDRSEKLPLKVVEQPFPHYPDGARKNRLEDVVVIRYTIGKNGRVIDLQILNHAKEAMFDEETINTIKQWRFRPLTINGKPVEVVHEVEVNYQFIQR